MHHFAMDNQKTQVDDPQITLTMATAIYTYMAVAN